MLRQAKRATITDSAAIIHRQHHIPTARKILIHRVRVVVVIKVMPAEQHLPHRPAMHKNQRRQFTRSIRRLEQLPMNLSAVSGFEDHLLGHNSPAEGKSFDKACGARGFMFEPSMEAMNGRKGSRAVE